MRIPNRIIEHPIEAIVASLLLLGLLFGSVAFMPGVTAPQAQSLSAEL